MGLLKYVCFYVQHPSFYWFLWPLKNTWRLAFCQRFISHHITTCTLLCYDSHSGNTAFRIRLLSFFTLTLSTSLQLLPKGILISYCLPHLCQLWKRSEGKRTEMWWQGDGRRVGRKMWRKERQRWDRNMAKEIRVGSVFRKGGNAQRWIDACK